MNHLNTSERKNVNVLGDDELTQVVGGWGGHWRRQGGKRQQGGGGGGGGNSSMRKHGGNDRRQKVIVKVFVVNVTVLDLGDVVAGQPLT